MYNFTYFQDAFTPKLRKKAQEWTEAQTKDMYGDELMNWAKARMKKMDVHALDEESTSRFYEDIDYEKIGKVYDYGMFLEECAIACKFFYFGNGGKSEEHPNTIGSGPNKLIISQIL